jgi:hypothetical protein
MVGDDTATLYEYIPGPVTGVQHYHPTVHTRIRRVVGPGTQGSVSGLLTGKFRDHHSSHSLAALAVATSSTGLQASYRI